MAQQPLSGRFIIGGNLFFRAEIQHRIQHSPIFHDAQRAVAVFDDRMRPARIKACDQPAVFIRPDRNLRLIAVSERLFHPHRAFHDFLDKFRRKSADPDQVIFYLAVFEGKLFFIGYRLKLAAAALARVGADRLHPVGRRLQHLLQTRVGVAFFCLYDARADGIAHYRILYKKRIARAQSPACIRFLPGFLQMPDAFPVRSHIRDLYGVNLIFLYVHYSILVGLKFDSKNLL